MNRIIASKQIPYLCTYLLTGNRILLKILQKQSYKFLRKVVTRNDYKTKHGSSLGDVERVENKNVLVVFCQCNDVTLRGDLQPAASAHFDVGTLELSDQMPVTLEHCDVEPVAVTVSYQNITRIADVNAIWIVGDVFTSDTMKKLAIFVEYDNTVALEVTDIVIFATDSNI